jgi:hypothetical protein
MKPGEKMYSVLIPWHASVSVTVDARDKDEAREKALELAQPGLCHHCAGEIDIGDFDESIEIEVVEIDPPRKK